MDPSSAISFGKFRVSVRSLTASLVILMGVGTICTLLVKDFSSELLVVLTGLISSAFGFLFGKAAGVAQEKGKNGDHS